MGWVRQSTGSFSLALLALASLPFAAGLSVLALGQGLSLQQPATLAGAADRRRADPEVGPLPHPGR